MCSGRRGLSVMYKIIYDKNVIKDIPKLKTARLDKKAKNLIEIVSGAPFQNPPPYEKLVGDLSGLYFRKINIKHRLVYQVYEDEKTIKILSMWTHYEY
jgi:toxin YoeB